MPTYTCPTCGRSVAVDRRENAPYRPFCGERCKLVDLDNWFRGRYRISEPAEESADHPPPTDVDE